MSSPVPSTGGATTLHPRARVWAIAGCLVLLILGFRWACEARYGMACPEWDQWDAEGRVLLTPWTQGHLGFNNFWVAHNEHHVALTRVMAFILTRLNHQWDQRVEAVFNAFLPAGIAAALLLLASRRLRLAGQLAVFVLLASLYALPIAWDNVVSGFHSQQFFLIGTAFIGIALVPFRSPRSPGWWFGILCLILALGTMGTGFFAAAVVAGMVLTGPLRGRHSPPLAVAASLLLCAVVVVLGFASRTVVSGDIPMEAHTLSDFLLTTVRALGWPAFDANWGYASLLLFLPWALVSARLFRRNRAPDAWAETLAGLGLWVFLQVLATAYARGDGGSSPPSRYIDTLGFGLAVNALCLAELWRTRQQSSRPASEFAVLGCAWVVLFGLGLRQHLTQNVPADEDDTPVYHHYCEENLKNYLATGDIAYLDHSEIPYPGGPSSMVSRLPASLLPLLPSTIRRPLALSADQGKGFDRYDSRVPQALNRRPRRGAGLSATTPPLSNAVTWGCYGNPAIAAAAWRSKPLTSPVRGWLIFQVAGNLGLPGTTLELHDAASGRLLAQVRADKIPRDSWRSAYVRAPSRAFVVEAHNDSPHQWLAFSEPVEMGRISYWAWQATRHGNAVMVAAGILLACVLIRGKKGAP